MTYKAEEITSIEYEKIYVPDGVIATKDSYLIFPDGRIEHSHFEGASDSPDGSGLRLEKKTTKKILKFSVHSLYKKVLDIIGHSDGTAEIIDDHDATLILHTQNESLKFPRGLRYGEKTLGTVMDHFVS